MLIRLFVFVFYFTAVYCWSYNPYCWLKNCYFTDCSQQKVESTISWRPSSWFKGYWKSEQKFESIWSIWPWTTNKEEQSTFRIYNPLSWFDYKEWKKDSNSWYCRFVNCKVDKQSESIFSMSALKSYIGSVIPNGASLTSIPKNYLNPSCWLEECCTESNIPGDMKKLHQLFDTRLFGQPFAEDIASAIEFHWHYRKSHKPLVLSFHGLPGTGKTLVGRLIAESLFKNGLKSKFFHYFNGNMHFPREEILDLSQHKLYHWITGNLTLCPKQLFIFDNINTIPSPHIFNDLVPILHLNMLGTMDFSKSIFIFISNNEGQMIKKKFIDLRQNNVERKKMKQQDFEKYISDKVYNDEDSVLYQFGKQNAVDHFIAFFPLEPQHVLEYIVSEFKQRGVVQPLQEHVDQIMEAVAWEEIGKEKYLNSDLRSLISKISLFTTRYYTNTDRNDL